MYDILDFVAKKFLTLHREGVYKEGNDVLLYVKSYVPASYTLLLW